jgi:predicted acetyltransferase
MPDAAKSTRVSYGPPRGDEERRALGTLLALSFGFPVADADVWFDRAGHSNARVIRSGSEVRGGLIQLPMGQHFGGRRVPMVGFAGVGVSPEARAKGVATDMMKRALRELHLRSVAISTLYPATMPLYRRAGFEIAGGWYRMRVAARDFPRLSFSTTDRELDLRRYRPEDERAVRQLYTRCARERNGWLDRSEYIWERIRRTRDGNAVHGHVLEGASGLEGYVFYKQRMNDHGFELDVTDMAAETPRGLRALVSFLGDHRSLAGEITWHGGVDDLVLASMTEHRYHLELRHHWMLRIVDVKSALEARGYPRRLKVALSFDIADDVIAANRGRWVLEVSGGRGKVKRGGRGELTVDVRGLASLYSGFSSAPALALLGKARGSDQTLRRATAVFAESAPSLPDMF